jgi:O-antigen/teichoic acid export membrane protein
MMSNLKGNLVANYLGQAWVALMGLAFLPVYIRYLGMEAYGLIGLFAVIQAWLSLLDMGMTPTLNREMARFTAGAHSPQSIRDLLRSLEILCLSLAMLIAGVLWAGSNWLAGEWLKADRLSTDVVAQALSLMAFVVAFRFVEGIYRGSLLGLQQQIWFNAASALLATIRQVGAVAVLAWYSATIEAFFLWQGFFSLLTVVVLAGRVYRTLPRAPRPPVFSRSALSGIVKFAGGMMGITFLAILLTQVDKVILSRLLPLESFGYYTLAATVAGVLYMVIGPITQALYPRMVELFTLHDHAGLASIYHRGAQLVTVLTAPAVMLLCCFAGGVIFVWSGNAVLAEKTGSILSVLVVGSFLNGLMYMPYQLQLAHGWTSLAVKTNMVAVVLLIPAIFWVVPRYGAVGAAWIWVTLNAGYILIALQFMHLRILPKEKWRWYVGDVLSPVCGVAAVALAVHPFQPSGYQEQWRWFVFLLFSGSLALAMSVILASDIRSRLWSILGAYFRFRPL